MGIYWPKSMYWRKPGERFVRPLRWLVAMLDEQIVPLEVAGIRAGNTSRGHRILGARLRESVPYREAGYLRGCLAQGQGSRRPGARAQDP